MSGLGIEAEAFLRAFFTGMLLCGIYEALRIFRRLIRHHPLFVSVEDFIYWLFAGFFLFGEIFSDKFRGDPVVLCCGCGSRGGIFLTPFLKNRKVLRKTFREKNWKTREKS